MDETTLKKVKLEVLSEWDPQTRDNFLKLQESVRVLATSTSTGKWFTDSVDPTPSVGNDGDFALNTTSGDLFKKTGGVWVKTGNIKGSTINTGNGAP